MLKNYIKTTVRNLWRNKTYSFLNIFGLTIGIACAGLIFLWVEEELAYNNSHAKKNSLYAVRENVAYEAGVFTHWSTPGVLAPAMKSEIPGIANTCRKSEGETSMLFSIADKPVYASGCYAEPSLFSMFTLPFVQGNAKTAFSSLYSIVITQRTAIKFFGSDKNIVGRTVRADNRRDFVITGVIENIPSNSSLQFEWVAPFDLFYQESPWLHEWGNNSLTTYIELDDNTSPATVNKTLYNYIQKKIPESITHLFLFSMTDWRLYDSFENGVQTGGGRIEYVHLFSVIAWIILTIACINFMNLATARSEKRSKEVGVRKVLGAGKYQLVLQFIGEAMFMSAVAAVLAVIVMSIMLPSFNSLVQKNLIMGLDQPLHAGALLAIALVCGLLAGSYPSLYLSSFKPIFVLKGIKLKSAGASIIRKGLVVIQFTVSIVLIIGTVIIYQQIQHVKNRDLGFKKENLVEMKLQGEMSRNYNSIKQELLNTGLVQNVALSDHETIYGGNNTGGFTWQHKSPGEMLVSVRVIDPGYLSTAGLKLTEGRDFVDADSSQPLRIIITESLARLMGQGSAIGKIIRHNGDSMAATVVGVVADYVYGNMYGKPDPVVFMCMAPRNMSLLHIRLKSSADNGAALAQAEAIMKKFNPAYPFDYRFVDDQFNDMFGSEMLIGRLSRVFSSLAIIISCLGLFGLAAYTAERRKKEIGIRKTLGASVSGIAGLLSKDFLKLVLLSAIVAFPLAWWMMRNWLEGYNYRVNISIWVFAAAGAGAVLIALITISAQAVKAALANPVESLKTE